MTLRAPRPIAWDLHEEHLDEATFLWARWEHALCSANYVLRELLEGPEARLLAHLDGLVLGGRPVADRVLLPALIGDEPERAAAAAWALVQAEDGDDHQDAVLDAWLAAESAASAAIARALSVSPRLDPSRIARLWTDAAPQTRASMLEIMSWREPGWTAQQLPAALRCEDRALVAAGLRILRRVRDRTLVGYVQELLQRDLGPVMPEAVATGMVLGSKQAWDHCRRLEPFADDACRLPLALLASSESDADRQIVLKVATQPSVPLHALWALGFVATDTAVELLLDAMSNKPLAKVAGEAFTAITGMVLEGELLVPGQTQGPDVEELGDEDPPPTVHSEDHLPIPNAPAVARSWQRKRTGYATGVRYCSGRERTPTALRAALSTAPMWRREALWLELARSGSLTPAVDLRTWAHEQARVLDATR